MKRRKKKNNFGYKFLGIIIIVASLYGALYYINGEYNIIEKFKITTKSIKKVEPKPIPKLQIIDEDSDTRPIAIMINNNHKAWPHSGLQDAYLNYEIIVEGGITRIMSIFKDKTTARIGSVRSARHYFLDYALENDAVYVHFGWSPQAQKDISSLKVNNLNGLYLSKLYWRDRSLKKATEHTAFTSMEKINALIKSKKFRSTSDKELLLNYTTNLVKLYRVEEAIKADKVYIDYSKYANTSYEYDPQTKLYKRTMNNIPHTDYVTKEQYTAKNIITYQVKNSSMGSKGRQTLSNIGSGTGYYITNGYALPITWEKKSRTDQTIYKYLNGNEIQVSDGVTWIQIQPKGRTLKIEAKEEVSSNAE